MILINLLIYFSDKIMLVMIKLCVVSASFLIILYNTNTISDSGVTLLENTSGTDILHAKETSSLGRIKHKFKAFINAPVRNVTPVCPENYKMVNGRCSKMYG